MIDGKKCLVRTGQTVPCRAVPESTAVVVRYVHVDNVAENGKLQQLRLTERLKTSPDVKSHLPDADTIVDVLLPAVNHAHKASLEGDDSVVQHVPCIGACARTKHNLIGIRPATQAVR